MTDAAPAAGEGGEGRKAAGTSPVRRRPGARSTLISFLHLAVLSAFALAQPLFNLLGKNPEFFAARGAPGFDIVSFAVLLVVVPPLVLVLVEVLLGLIHPRAGQVAHLLFVAIGFALILLQALKKAMEGSSDGLLIGLAVALGLALAALYSRAEPLRSFVSVLSPAPLVFLFLFLVISPVSKVAFASQADAKSVGGVSRTNVVVVLFDELPDISLQTRDRRIDPVRYPHFADLAKDGTWFRHAYTVYDSTERAQPAIMDGNYPDKDKLPTSSDHPNSIFSLFGKTHRMNVSEEATAVCSRKLCKDEREDEGYPDRLRSMADDLGQVWLHVVSPPKAEEKLPSVSENWGNFGGGSGDGSAATTSASAGGSSGQPNTRKNLNGQRNHRFEDWIAKIKPANKPQLSLKHTLLPHVPWQYLPDAKEYRRTARDPIPGLSSKSYRDENQIVSLQQRHLLQLGFADHLLGELIRHLKKEGMYDNTLLVVTADHGVAFDKGYRDRRKITRRNAPEIAPIPLFFKAPNQTRGGVIKDSYPETVDILPTIGDILNLKFPHEDGTSAFSKKVRDRKVIRIFQRNTFKPMRFAVPPFAKRVEYYLERRVRRLGQGSDGPERLYEIGPHTELLRKQVSSLDVGAKPAGLSAGFVAAKEFRQVKEGSPFIPVHVTGTIKGAPQGQKRDVAIAVNGRIQAVSSSFQLTISKAENFAAMVPENSFHQGRNRVVLYEVQGSPGALRLLPLGLSG